MGILIYYIIKAIKSLVDDWNAAMDMGPWYIKPDIEPD